MGSQILTLQKAIYEVLNNDVTLSMMVEDVFNYVPPKTKFPYVVISTGESEDVSSLACHKENISMELNIYSEQKGAKEALEIAGEIHRILHQQPLMLEGGYELEMLQVRDTDVRQLTRGNGWLSQLHVEARVFWN